MVKLEEKVIELKTVNGKYRLESSEYILNLVSRGNHNPVKFEITNKETKEKNRLGFDLRFWQSFQYPEGGSIQQASGMYIFRPAKHQKDST